jgi:ubiquinone/menaquinone biosynthesis C-methylase UbiE
LSTNREDGSARSFRARARRTFDAASSFYGFFDFFSKGVFTEAAARLSKEISIGPRTMVLEVFCATGLFSRILAGTGARITAVDISPLMIRRAESEARGLGVGFLTGDAADLPFGDGAFDLVVAGRGLHGMPPAVRDAAVDEINRVCGGYALFMEPKRPAGVLARAVMEIFERLEGGYEHYREFITLDFKTYLSGRGFTARDLMLQDNEHVILCRRVRAAFSNTSVLT